MKDVEFLTDIEDLTGRVAIVTGGAKGIGLETSIYLATKGATVYIAARDSEGTHAGIEDARNRLNSLVATTGTTKDGDHDGPGSRIKYHELDLSSMQTSWKSAQEFKKVEKRLDILVCNAGVSMTTMRELSPDGYDMMFTVNHLSHFAFVAGLLDVIKETADTTQDGRIVFTNSNAYKLANKLDYKKLTTTDPNDGERLKDIANAFGRYGDSKLAAIYGVIELSNRVRQNLGIKNVFINSCHPGAAVGTALGTGHQKAIGPTMERIVRSALSVTMGNTTADCAKTPVYLAGSKYVKDHETHGEFWMPNFSLLGRSYKGCGKEEYTALGRDEDERKKLWSVTIEAFNKAVSKEAIESSEEVKRLIQDPNQ